MKRISDLGCGVLTLLFILLPVWVMTTAWRGPVYAVGALAVIFVLVIAVALLTSWFDRR